LINDNSVGIYLIIDKVINYEERIYLFME